MKRRLSPSKIEERKKAAEDVRYFANALRGFLRLDPLYSDGRAGEEARRRERFGRPTNIRKAKKEVIHHE